MVDGGHMQWVGRWEVVAELFAGAAILLAVFLRKPETDPAGDQRA